MDLQSSANIWEEPHGSLSLSTGVLVGSSPTCCKNGFDGIDFGLQNQFWNVNDYVKHAIHDRL